MNELDYVGSICSVGQTFISPNYHACDGAMLGIADYGDLYSIITTTFGGDGRRTMGLPNLGARVPIGSGTSGQGTEYTLGQKGGAEFPGFTLTSDHLPKHTHTASFNQSDLNDLIETTVDISSSSLSGGLGCHSSSGGGTSPAGAYPGRPSNGAIEPWAGAADNAMAADLIDSGEIKQLAIETRFSSQQIPAAVSSSGSGAPFFGLTSLPSLATYYLIAVNGLYPKRPEAHGAARQEGGNDQK